MAKWSIKECQDILECVIGEVDHLTQQEIYRIVLDDLLKESIYRGIYDPKNSDDSFMYGIFFVMQYIAYRAGEEMRDTFAYEFFNNMTKSEREAEQRERN